MQAANNRLTLTLSLVGIGFGLLFVLLTAHLQRTAAQTELERESAILHRLISQRADQHAAHLTSLSALASSRDNVAADLFLQVAAAIRQFYPRVAAVYLVPLTTGQPTLTTRGADAFLTQTEALIRMAAARSTGELVSMSSPMPGHYLLVKRSPNTDAARFGLALEIDGNALLETDAPFWRRGAESIALAMADGSRVVGGDVGAASGAGECLQPLAFSKVLGSQTQPYLLQTTLRQELLDLLPAKQLGMGFIAIATLLIALGCFLNMHGRTRRAELRARLGEQEARIAHASRVNALGELASGMAHELTQPLTAILSQSQAGVRMLVGKDGGLGTIRGILEANVAQSKRAADILSRLRQWTRHGTPISTRQSLNGAVENVQFLLGAEAQRLKIKMSVDPHPNNPYVLGDAVEIEQVIFNLTRNAMDALRDDGKPNQHIQLRTGVTVLHAFVNVIDNGPGLPPEMLARLFEPFATTKEGGMGLGLALCERIVERMGGSIELSNAQTGGVSAQVLLPREIPQGDIQQDVKP